MKRQRIYSPKNNGLNDQDRLDLSRMLLKAGYAVKIGKERSNPNVRNSAYKYYIEFWEEKDE